MNDFITCSILGKRLVLNENPVPKPKAWKSLAENPIYNNEPGNQVQRTARPHHTSVSLSPSVRRFWNFQQPKGQCGLLGQAPTGGKTHYRS